MRRENRRKAAGGDGNWKDKLTAYDGKGITYNAIGNPLSYDGWSYTWEGRRLMGMSRSGVGNGGSYGSLSLNAAAMTLSHTQGTQDAGDAFSVDQAGNLTVSTDKAPGSYFLAEGVLKAEEVGGSAQAVSYQYNASGLRVSKTVDGVTTQYTLHGKLITHLKKGTDELHFFYDAQGKPAMVEFNGSYYAYVHTLQGDIAAIVDNTGTKVVEYGYDAWGKPTKAWSLTHPSDSTLTSAYAKLAQLNPFRYRGYVWDEETGLYYLRSRYYDPAWERFLNADAILETDGSPLAHNPFSYCRNLPIVNSDPEGFYDYYAFMYNKTNSVLVFPVQALTIEQAAAITSPEAWGEYAGYAGGPNVGVYTLEWYNAMALAHRVGTRIPIPEEHSGRGPGIYNYHFHPENHGTHIGYGAPIMKP